MLSILIPIYNINCAGLVENLVKQCSELLDKFEIICIDDHSDEKFRIGNLPLFSFKNVYYIELSQNIGRAEIRNLLAKKASNENLLFIDADSQIIRNDFIRKYAEYSKSENVIYGGTNYQKYCREDHNKILHWKYASKYEALPVAGRNKKPYLAFMSNNFLIKRQIFDEIQFNASHAGYGYEDTLFAEEIKRRAYRICHIDNPVEHTGLSDTDVFLDKTEEAMRNLAKMYYSGLLLNTSMIRFYDVLKTYRIHSVTALIVRKMLPFIFRNLRSRKPDLYCFQLFKYLRFFEEVSNIKAEYI
jgi:glycosyltransferase involved in cell wall biosynthesis